MNGTPAEAATRSLLIRGRLRSDTTIIEPVFVLAASSPAALADNSDFTVQGFSADGALLFEAPFEPGDVADLGGVTEQHFDLRVPIGQQMALRLHSVEVRRGDRTMAARTALFSASDYEREVASADIVTAERIEDGRVRVRWDTERSPMVIVVLPSTGEILTFGRSGEVVVATSEGTLQVALSDGVQSRVKVVRVR